MEASPRMYFAYISARVRVAIFVPTYLELIQSIIDVGIKSRTSDGCAVQGVSRIDTHIGIEVHVLTPFEVFVETCIFLAFAQP